MKFLPHLVLIATTSQSLMAADLTVTSTADSGAGSLRQAVADAASGDRVVFDPSLDGLIITISSGELTLSKNLTIDASALSQGITLDAASNSRILAIGPANSTVEIINLTFGNGRGGDAEAGGALFVNGISTTLTNCTFDSNETVLGNNGGAISHSAGSLSITGCTFTNNATRPSPSASGGLGGAIWSQTTLTIADSLFDGNSTADGGVSETSGLSGGNGGALYAAGAVTITGSTFSNNQTGNGNDGIDVNRGARGGGGGAIFSGGPLIISDSTISNNETGFGGLGRERNSGGRGGSGGGLFFDESLTMTRCLVSGNRTGNGGFDDASGGGGGIATFSNVTFLIEDSSIADNHTGQGAGHPDGVLTPQGFGGGLSLGGTGELVNCTISGNTCGRNGGGISSFATRLTLTQCTIVQNQGLNPLARGGGLAVSNGDNDVIYKNTVVAKNSTPLALGADHSQFSGTFTVEGSGLLENTNGLSLDIPAELITGVSPALSPLGVFGGTLPTHIPFPGSPLIDAGGPAPIGDFDQRGLPRPVTPADLGAVEVQADEDYTLIYQSDFDGDGNPYLLEEMIGTDPSVFDSNSPRVLKIAQIDQSTATFTFSRSSSASPDFDLILQQSGTLDGPESFVEILTITAGGQLFLTPRFQFSQNGEDITFTDTARGDGPTFYRLLATPASK